MLIKEVTIKNAIGLYARPATFFIQKANEFKCIVYLEYGSKRVNAKSLLGVLSLGIASGEKMNIIADGDDENDAMSALVSMIEKDFKEE
ncbi:MAG: HPr family phosphocarrier protein [Oscillospiraceae bacterium]|jgi:phosphocarrier protein|nr:HPr family phosphocarrier protein [Oscillospiraceae bacterium]